MNVVHDVTIDLLNPRKNVVHVVQEDSMRTLRLTLLSDCFSKYNGNTSL